MTLLITLFLALLSNHMFKAHIADFHRHWSTRSDSVLLVGKKQKVNIALFHFKLVMHILSRRQHNTAILGNQLGLLILAVDHVVNFGLIQNFEAEVYHAAAQLISNENALVLAC